MTFKNHGCCDHNCAPIDGVLPHFQPTRKGDPELPLTDDEGNNKYLEFAAPVIGDATARKLLEALRSLEKFATVEFGFASAAPARLAG